MPFYFGSLVRRTRRSPQFKFARNPEERTVGGDLDKSLSWYWILGVSILPHKIGSYVDIETMTGNFKGTEKSPESQTDLNQAHRLARD